MSDLAGFVAARLDEDEAAVACDEAFRAWWPGHAARYNSRSPVAAREAFAAGWDAARAQVLREVAAKRAIIELAADATALDMQVDMEFATTIRDQQADPYCGDLILRALASAWSDHPDFDPAWVLPEQRDRTQNPV